MPGRRRDEVTKPVARFAMAGSLNRFKAELMRRDPMGRDYVELKTGRKSDPQRERSLEEELSEKYGTSPIVLLWDWRQIDKDVAERRSETIADMIDLEQDAIRFEVSGTGMPRKIEHDGVTFYPGSRNKRSPTGPRRCTIEVALDRINQWDLDDISARIKRIIRDVLRATPKGPNTTGDDVPELAFLHHVRPETLEQDLRRYDFHFQDGLSFRQIAVFEAAIEDAKARGRTLTVDECRKAMSGIVGRGAQRESSVGASVRRIFKAIYRRPYEATLPQMDTASLSIGWRRRLPTKGKKIGRKLASGWEKSTT